MTIVDLRPAAERMSELIRGVPDDRLDRATPCPEYDVGGLLNHIAILTVAFTATAAKDPAGKHGARAGGDASLLPDDWREAIPRDLVGLAEAWRDPEAWGGITWAGGVELPGEVAGVVALDELVLHGWDLARATGQPYEPDPASLAAVDGFVTQMSEPGLEAVREGLFGPVVPVPDDAPPFDRVLGLSGREPDWTAE
jgi:uncharacterized protein (TIGR03086 family)